jgi:predicted CXXCH cytochrome family protein
MKALLYITLVSLFLVGIATISNAFHGSGLECEKCHTMHYSKNGGIPPGADATGPFEYLLIKEHVTELCLTCHDGQTGTPDVVGGDVNASSVGERAAGHFDDADVVNYKGHNLGLDKVGPEALCLICHFGGNFLTAKVGCTDCHDPHGYTGTHYRYRNLQWASEPGGEPIITAFVKSGISGIAAYDRANIGYTAPTTEASSWVEVTNVCLDCHHTLSGDHYTRNDVPGGTCVRHPNTDSENGAWEKINQHDPPQTDPAHWVGGTGSGFGTDRLPFIVSGATDYGEATTVAQDNEVFCLTCHKAHGSTNSFSLRWAANSNADGCQQCHNK